MLLYFGTIAGREAKTRWIFWCGSTECRDSRTGSDAPIREPAEPHRSTIQSFHQNITENRIAVMRLVIVCVAMLVAIPKHILYRKVSAWQRAIHQKKWILKET